MPAAFGPHVADMLLNSQPTTAGPFHTPSSSVVVHVEVSNCPHTRPRCNKHPAMSFAQMLLELKLIFTKKGFSEDVQNVRVHSRQDYSFSKFQIIMLWFIGNGSHFLKAEEGLVRDAGVVPGGCRAACGRLVVVVVEGLFFVFTWHQLWVKMQWQKCEFSCTEKHTDRVGGEVRHEWSKDGKKKKKKFVKYENVENVFAFLHKSTE